MGNTCIPVADSFWYMAKPIQYCKVKLNKIKKIKSNKEKREWKKVNRPLNVWDSFKWYGIHIIGVQKRKSSSKYKMHLNKMYFKWSI